jgi:hypothetical protein
MAENSSRPVVELLPSNKLSTLLPAREIADEAETSGVVSESKHRVVVCSRLGDRLDDIPMLDHLPVFRPVNVNDGFAARTVRQAVPLAVEDDVIPVREDALDLAMRSG